MKATDKQISYLVSLAQRIMRAHGTPGVEEQTIAMAKHCATHCHTYSKDKASALIDDFRFLVRSINSMRSICNLKQI